MIFHRLKRKSATLLFLFLSACGLTSRCGVPDPLAEAEFNALYETPLAPATSGLSVYHLGHSLVGRDMPVMLEQLGGADHSFNSQLGWGSMLREHWEPDMPVKGFEQENQHVQYRDPHAALAEGSYDALVLTESVEIRDSIKYHNPQDYLHKWATAAWDGNPQTRIYLYETWHNLDDPEGWLTRLDLDLDRYWETEILRRALAHDDVTQPIYVIPGGQVMAAFARRLQDAGGIGPVKTHEDLFFDTIHFNDYGAYLMALTHYAVLYGRSPVGLPHALLKSDGTPADDPGPELAAAMQETVWQVVTGYAPSGVRGD
ncbi:hypothetical protein [Tateyamaria omphalii]|uniref:Uncharacterized protein n=1 Tax=Tateyamaria omphalii TaxID=299262 RepID=A0A1P8N1Y1_9RHOB|nr:hypothetical protein [Tateyamaria omphalii]APX14324.1 hypothetical protein BWR18_20975 [Tateyamaria omphalii]